MLLHGLCSLCNLNILPRDAQLNTSNGYDYVILWILCAMLAKARDHGVCTLLCDMFGGPSLLDIDGSCITRSRTHTHDWGDHTIEYLFCCIFHLVIIFPNTFGTLQAMVVKFCYPECCTWSWAISLSLYLFCMGPSAF